MKLIFSVLGIAISVALLAIVGTILALKNLLWLIQYYVKDQPTAEVLIRWIIC
jgi:hypothetical protein